MYSVLLLTVYHCINEHYALNSATWASKPAACAYSLGLAVTLFDQGESNYYDVFNQILLVQQNKAAWWACQRGWHFSGIRVSARALLPVAFRYR
jgi:hypothetical protein